mmetsp:Transcript_9022/g.22277  ORF Transcript_9022/g.22277 Transcript_9022/m.22277 type:complete len:189 (+) Transcript_9022:263-829(+)
MSQQAPLMLGRDRQPPNALAFWNDPAIPEAEIRKALEIQVKANQALRVQLSETEAKLRDAQTSRIQAFESAEGRIGGADQEAMTSVQLQEQVRLRDSIITCLQQEVAMIKNQKVSDTTDTTPVSDTDTLAMHLNRAKARSQAVADQFVSMYSEERRAMHLFHHSAPLHAPRADVTASRQAGKLQLLSP